MAAGLELDIIAAVVIGGGSLSGGEGSILGSMIGALIMAHGDDNGIVIPPRLATTQVVVIPIFRKPEERERVIQAVENFTAPFTAAGIGFKIDGKLHFTPERPLKRLTDMPAKAYQLADFDAYEKVCGRRWAMYVSSLACPFNCAYCTNAGVYGRKWNALPVEQVVEETVDLTRRYRLELLWMSDVGIWSFRVDVGARNLES